MTNKERFRQEFNNITDILSGDEGGVPFAKANAFLNAMADQADGGDASAAAVLEIVYKFNKLLNVAANPPQKAFKKRK